MAHYHLGFPITEAVGRFGTTLFVRVGTDQSGRPYKRMRDMKHRKPERPWKPDCQYWKLSDWIYQQKDPNDIAYWRRHIKAPYTSPYDLWMSECLACFFRTGRGPAGASISGGFSLTKLRYGGDWVAPTPDHQFDGKNGWSFHQPII